MGPLLVKDRCILEDFDRGDEKNIGRPLFWNLANHIIAVESMICADELEIAMRMCDEIPAWYRVPENYPEELTRIKKILYQNRYSPMCYADDEEEASYSREKATDQAGTIYTYPRYEILSQLVGSLNEQGKVPWIFELSPSHGLLPLGLARDNFKFKFFGKNLNHRALAKLIEWLGPEVWTPHGPGPDQPTIFVCTEAIEHMHRPEDVVDNYMKLGIEFDHLILSVPNGCLGHGLSNWKTRRLGHIRTYTPKEFLNLADKFFPGYKWHLWPSVSIVLHGTKS